MSYCIASRKRVKWLKVLCLLAAVMAAASIPAQSQTSTTTTTREWHDNPFGIAVTRWADSDKSKPTSFQSWRQQVGTPGRFVAEFASLTPAMRQDKRASRFDVIVNTFLYDAISASLDQYVADLTADEYDVAVIKVSGGTAEEFRNLLINEYSLGMVGCVLIGNLPIAWYESECWEEKEHEEFPCDLFYMDLDGLFGDSDSDGRYDTHTGDVTPEIWIGRLTASPLTMGGSTEVELLQNYFRKNHLYRTGRLSVGSRALVYIDDDWASESGSWSYDVSHAYSTRTLVDDLTTTCASDYTKRLPQGYDLIEVCVHSSPSLHSFKVPSGSWSDVTNSQIKSIDPQAHFYNLFACSNARFVETNYMGGWYVFCDTYGLAAVGSAKTGSMLEFGAFYEPFGQGKTFGEAFSDWFTARGGDGFEPWEVCWYYGMTLCGDPTLRKLPAVTAQNSFGPAPLMVDFTSDIGLPVTGCSWDFGDGQNSATQNVSHQYAEPGCYDVSITMNTASGAFRLRAPQLVSAYADTFTVGNVIGTAGMPVSVDIGLHNALAVGKITVPYRWSGPLSLAFDSFSTAGLRTAYFPSKVLTSVDPGHRQATVTLDCTTSGTQSYLSPGDGPVVTLWFTVPPAAIPGANPIEVIAYSDNTPRLQAEAGDYTPVINHGSVTLNCCTGPSVGNLDGSADNLITMSDLTVMIDHLFITLTPVACLEAANVDMSTDDLVTMSDLTVLIDHLFITLAPLPQCGDRQ
jgi:PKD repeat protein